jgi:hypothetical protein
VASKICDTEPCDKLKVALRHHFEVEQQYDPDKGMLFVHMKRKGPGDTLDRVYLRYCPFCGTRMVLGLVDGLELLLPSPSPRRSAQR